MVQPQQTRETHPYFMHDAILDQPRAVGQMLATQGDSVGQAVEAIANKRRIYLVGIGTSWHAALIAEHWFRRFAQGALEVQAWHSFEFYSYPPALSPEDAVIVISHRGTKTYSFLALELAKSCGAFTLAITSTNPGPRDPGCRSGDKHRGAGTLGRLHRELHIRPDGAGDDCREPGRQQFQWP